MIEISNLIQFKFDVKFTKKSNEKINSVCRYNFLFSSFNFNPINDRGCSSIESNNNMT